ncbi:MAG: OmpA family protein [Crocinitomicaceae bacterium]
MLRVLSILFFSIAFSGFAQTYQIIEVSVECESKAIEGLNSKGSDFCPVVFNDAFYFTSSREYDLVNIGENNWNKLQRLNVFEGKIKGDLSEEIKVKGVNLVSQKIMTDNHTGPMCLSVTGDTMFFTQVQPIAKKRKSRKDKYRPQLYMSIKIGNDWDDPVLLPFSDDKFSFGHPSYDSKNKRLYFASDYTGSKGGKDIFYSEIKQSQWGTPQNAGNINTAANELFPHYVDGFLFFSSDRSNGQGGLDIFWKLLRQELDEPRPAVGLNGPQDDFGIFVLPGMNAGFYSSNSDGSDDIFYFTMEKKVTVKNELAGKFTYRNINGNPTGLQVMVVNEDDEMLFETTTNEKGNFKFSNIDYDGNYQIKAKTEDDLYLTIFDKDGNPVTDLVTDENGSFTYKKLGYDSGGTLALIPEDMVDMTLNQGHLSGQFVYEKIPGEYPGQLKVLLVDEDGNMKFTTFTDENGNFDFKQLDMDENYLLKVPENSDDLILLIFDKKGNVVAQLKGSSEGNFNYRKLKADYSNSLKVIEENEDMFVLESQTISGYFEYKNLKNEFENGLKVQAYNEDGLLLEETTTDDKGKFRFRNLPVDDNLLFKVNEKDENLELDDFTLYIFDRNGKKIAQLKRGQNDYFIFKPLGFENTDLTQIKEDSLDITIQTSHDIVTVYFDSNKSNAKSADLKFLWKLYTELKDNPSLKVEINAYADARNSDEYNLILSGKRGDWVVDYFVKKGISKNRFIVNAYGEAGLISLDNDALNRRAEIRVY